MDNVRVWKQAVSFSMNLHQVTDEWAFLWFNANSALALTDPELYDRLNVEGALA